MRFRNLSTCFLISLPLLLVTPAHADDPFLTDNPEVLLPHQQYAVLYSYYNQYHFAKALQAPGLEFDFNVFPDFEVDTYTSLTNLFDSKTFPNMPLHGTTRAPNATGISDIDVELKYRFLHETVSIPQVAFVPNFYLPTGNYRKGIGNGRFFYYPALAAQKTFGTWLIYSAAGYVINGAPDLNNYFFGGIVVQKQINKKLALGVELYNQGRSGRFIASSSLLNVGTQYEITKGCTLLASIGHSVRGENVFLSYVGVGWMI